jgi:tetratricopeptide (TPR) repeat protein
MSRLLEILGGGITVETADLIWHWLSITDFKQADVSTQKQFDKILELIAEQDTKNAETEIKLYLFENPSCIRGRLAAAAVYLQESRINPAIEQLTNVYNIQPNNTMALYALGHCYERIGKESQATEFYQDCIKFKNYLQLPRQRLAAIYFKNGQLEKTIKEFEALKNEYPDDISTITTLGYLYISTGRNTEAIDTFNTAILMHPDNFLTSIDDDIEQCILEGNLAIAMEKIDQLLAEQPKRADMIVKKADVLGMMDQADEAIESYEQAIRICPDFLEAAIKLGTQYLKIQQNQLAAQQFNKAVEINDRIVDAYIGLATAQKEAGKNSETLATLSLAAAIQPNSSLLLAETATLQFKTSLENNFLTDNQDDSDNLIEAVIKAHKGQINTNPQNPDLYYRLGILLMNVQRNTDAIKAFKTTLQINPTYHRARSKLAICLFETGKKKAAIEKLAMPVNMDKNTLQLHYKTALLYCDKIKFASSLINLEQYMENNFTSVEATVNISIVLQNLGLLDRVTAMWENLYDTANQAINKSRPF